MYTLIILLVSFVFAAENPNKKQICSQLPEQSKLLTLLRLPEGTVINKDKQSTNPCHIHSYKQDLNEYTFMLHKLEDHSIKSIEEQLRLNNPNVITDLGRIAFWQERKCGKKTEHSLIVFDNNYGVIFTFQKPKDVLVSDIQDNLRRVYMKWKEKFNA